MVRFSEVFVKFEEFGGTICKGSKKYRRMGEDGKYFNSNFGSFGEIWEVLKMY